MRQTARARSNASVVWLAARPSTALTAARRLSSARRRLPCEQHGADAGGDGGADRELNEAARQAARSLGWSSGNRRRPACGGFVERAEGALEDFVAVLGTDGVVERRAAKLLGKTFVVVVHGSTPKSARSFCRARDSAVRTAPGCIFRMAATSRGERLSK
jgi:hypothetical protein